MTLIPEGTWRGRAVTYEWGWTSHDVEQIGVQLVLSPGQDAEVDGRTLTWYGTFSEKAEPYTLKTLRALGCGDNLADLSGIDQNEVNLVVVHEADYNDPTKTRARVRFINPIGSGGIAMKNRMLPEQVQALAERMRGKMMAAARATPSAAPPRSPTPASTAKPAPSPAAQRAQAAAQKAAQAASTVTGQDDDHIPF